LASTGVDHAFTVPPLNSTLISRRHLTHYSYRNAFTGSASAALID